MTQFEFYELCQKAKPISVEYYQYGEITITFDNGVVVEVDKEMDWDSVAFTFKTNAEKEKEQLEREQKFSIEKKEKLRKLKLKNSLKKKLGEEEFEKIKDILST